MNESSKIQGNHVVWYIELARNRRHSGRFVRAQRSHDDDDHDHDAAGASSLVGEVLFRILLAGLFNMISKVVQQGAQRLTFAGLPTFCPMTFHLLDSYSLIAASSAALCQTVSWCGAQAR